MNEAQRQAGRREWEAWRRVCGLLAKAGAVKQADLLMRVSASATTPGLEVLQAIREWGGALGDMRDYERVPPPGALNQAVGDAVRKVQKPGS